MRSHDNYTDIQQLHNYTIMDVLQLVIIAASRSVVVL